MHKKILVAMLMMAMSVTTFVTPASIFASEASESETKEEAVSNESSEQEKGAELAAEATVYPLTIKDKEGKEVVIEKKPEVIAVYDMVILDTLKKLGLTDLKVIGPKANIPGLLEAFPNYIEAGSMKEPDFELINENKVELAFISGRQKKIEKDFHELAPTLYFAADSETFFEDALATTEAVGKIFDKQADIQAFAEEVKVKVDTLKEKVSSDDRKLLFLMVNDGNISAYGKGSRFGFFYDLLGYKLADENIEVSTHGQEVNYEYISKTNPDMIFFMNRGKAVGKGDVQDVLSDNDLVKGTSAGQNGAIYELDAADLYLISGGLTSIERIVDSLLSTVYKG